MANVYGDTNIKHSIISNPKLTISPVKMPRLQNSGLTNDIGWFLRGGRENLFLYQAATRKLNYTKGIIYVDHDGKRRQK